MKEPTLVPLFVYAELEESPDHDGEPAIAFGELRQRGADAAAKFLPLSNRPIHGQLRYVPWSVIRELDRSEEPEYLRANIIVLAGYASVGAYAYQYQLADFDSLPLIWDGRFKGPEEGL